MALRIGTPVIVGSGASARFGFIAGDLDPNNPGDGLLIATATPNVGAGTVTWGCGRMQANAYTELTVAGSVNLSAIGDVALTMEINP